MKKYLSGFIAAAAVLLLFFPFSFPAAARPLVPDDLLAKIEAIDQFMVHQGYEAGSIDSGKALREYEGIKADFLRYTKAFSKTTVVRAEKGGGGLLDDAARGEKVTDRITVTLFYPDWLDEKEACSPSEFSPLVKAAFSKARKHFDLIASENAGGKNRLYREDIQKKVFTNAPDGNYELEQQWFRTSSGPAQEGWNVNEGGWSMFHQPWKNLDEYSLNAHRRLFGAAFSLDIPFAFLIRVDRRERTDADPGSGGKLSEDLSKASFWKPLEDKGDKILEILLSAHQQNTAPTAPQEGDVLEPGVYIRVEAIPSSLPADGASRSTVTVSAWEVEERGGKRKPLAGKKVALSLAASEGMTPGTLSAATVTTDQSGAAAAEFIAPAETELQGREIRKATVIAECPELGRDEASIQLETFAPLAVEAQHSILPAGPSFENRITFTFGAPGELQAGKTLKAVISAAAEGGRLSSGEDHAGKGARKIEIEAVPGVPNTVHYFWGGEPPAERAVDEAVTVEIPDRKYRRKVSFSVGVDLALLGGGPLVSGTFFPGVFIPFRVYVHDRFHKDSDLGALFEAYSIEPVLEVLQSGYDPLPAMDPKEDFYSRLAAHVRGALSPGRSLCRDILVGGVRRDKDGGWFLTWKEYDGEGLTGSSFPGIIPWSRGTYRTELRFDPKWIGDAAQSDHSLSLLPLPVEGKGQWDAHMESFIIPLLKSSLSMFPGGESALLAVDVSVELQKTGDITQAALSVGRHFFLDFLGGKIGESIQSGLESALEKKIWGTARGKRLQDRMADLVKRANEGIPGTETMTAEQIGACIDSGKEILAGYIAGMFADAVLQPLGKDRGNLPCGFSLPFCASPAWAGADPAGELAPLASFLKGYGGAGILLVENRKGSLGNIRSGNSVLKSFSGQVFALRPEEERVLDAGKWLAVPLKKEEPLFVSVKPGVSSLRLCFADAGGIRMTSIGEETPLGRTVKVLPSGFSSQDAARESASRGRAAGSAVRMREDHSLEGRILGRLEKDEPVEILEKWSSPGDMAIIREDFTGSFNGRPVSFRKGMGVHVIEHIPGSEELLVGFMENGEFVQSGIHFEYVEVQEVQTWYLVRTEKGLEGWVFGKFISEER